MTFQNYEFNFGSVVLCSDSVFQFTNNYCETGMKLLRQKLWTQLFVCNLSFFSKITTKSMKQKTTFCCIFSKKFHRFYFCGKNTGQAGLDALENTESDLSKVSPYLIFLCILFW